MYILIMQHKLSYLVIGIKKAFSIKNIFQFIPITQWLPNYQRNFFKWDLIAGITLASFVLPESMAMQHLQEYPLTLAFIVAL
jgi:MFS superfamily sulfate permease-like transporter